MGDIGGAVRRFLGGGSAEEIYNLACQSDDTMKSLVESAGVVDKLVDLTLRDQTAGESDHWAFYALCTLVEIGRVAQDATAHAHDGAIFKWLAGPQDHGRADVKNSLITNFTNDHPANTLILDAVRRGDAARLAELVLESLQSGDTATAAFSMSFLVVISHERGATFTLPDSSFAALARLRDWELHSSDSQLSAMRGQAESVLAHFIRAEMVRRGLVRTQFESADQLKLLMDTTSDPRGKLLAVLRLRELANEDGTTALKIASRGGLPALVAAASSVDDGGILVKDLSTQAANLLAVLAQGTKSIREQTQQHSDMMELLQLCGSDAQSHVAVALDVFRGILQNDSDVEPIAQSWGISLVFELLQFAKIYCPKHESAVVRVLDSVLFSAEDSMNEANQRAFLQCDGAVKLLVDLSASPPTDQLNAFTEKLGWVVLELIPRLRNGQADGIDDISTVIKLLEVLSRVQANQRVFRQHEGVNLLVDRLRATRDPHDKLHVARILANISYRNDEMVSLIVELDALKPLGEMLSTVDPKHQTAALMALRNLASNDISRNEIVSLGLLLSVVELASKAESMKQRVVAAAVLGNLARLSTNRKFILHHGGDNALLQTVQKTTTAPRIETVAAALWMLAKDDATVSRLRGKSGAATVEKAIGSHPPQNLPWATRLLQRLK